MILLDWDLKRMTRSMKRKDKFLINNSIFIGGGGYHKCINKPDLNYWQNDLKPFSKSMKVFWKWRLRVDY